MALWSGKFNHSKNTIKIKSNKASEKYLNNNRYSTRSITYVDSDDRENRAGDGERQTEAEQSKMYPEYCQLRVKLLHCS